MVSFFALNGASGLIPHATFGYFRINCLALYYLVIKSQPQGAQSFKGDMNAPAVLSISGGMESQSTSCTSDSAIKFPNLSASCLTPFKISGED
jgi:hypothetical protein